MGGAIAAFAALFAVLSGIGAKPPEEATAAAEPPTLTPAGDEDLHGRPRGRGAAGDVPAARLSRKQDPRAIRPGGDREERTMDTKTKALVAAALLGLSGAAAADPLSGGALPCEGNAPRDYLPPDHRDLDRRKLNDRPLAAQQAANGLSPSTTRSSSSARSARPAGRRSGIIRSPRPDRDPSVVGSLSPGEYVARSLLRRLRRDDDPSTHGTHPGCHRHAVIAAAPEPPAPPPTTPPEEPDAPEPAARRAYDLAGSALHPPPPDLPRRLPHPPRQSGSDRPRREGDVLGTRMGIRPPAPTRPSERRSARC